VFYARSDDGGKSFQHVTPLGTADFSQPAHVQLTVGDSGTVAVAWDDGTLQTPRIALRISRDGGDAFAPTHYVSAQGSAASFPVLALDGKRLTVAWTSQTAEYARTVAAERPDMSDPHMSMGLPEVGQSEVLVRSGALK
jgi:hypothetical protein